MLTRRALIRAAALTAAGVAASPVMTGCGAKPGGASAGGSGLVTSPTARRAADRTARPGGARILQAFGAELFRAMSTEAGNLVCSPYSVAVALGMTRNGARGATAEEMDRVLHSRGGLSVLNSGLNAVTQHVEGLAHERKRPDGSLATVTIDAANSLWGQQGERWERPFLDALAESYGTGMRQVDYIEATESARESINGWTSDQTHTRIPELIPPRLLDSDTRLVLVNAIYLKAPWATPFEKALTEDGAFTRRDGTTVRVPMMRSDSASPLAYARGAGWQAVDLPYDGGGLAMAVIVPDAGRLDDVVQGFDDVMWRGLLGEMRRTAVALRLPRWTFRTQAQLTDVLSQLGMPTAFSDSADLSGMTRDEQLRIAHVVHEAFVAVDEAGTEAAAATAVVASRVSAIISNVELTIDRPFLFVVHDTETGTPLFTGRVSDPSDGR